MAEPVRPERVRFLLPAMGTEPLQDSDADYYIVLIERTVEQFPHAA